MTRTHPGAAEPEYDVWYANAWKAAKRCIVEARKRGELPSAEEERPMTESEQRRLEALQRVAWHAKLRADRRAKM